MFINQVTWHDNYTREWLYCIVGAAPPAAGVEAEQPDAEAPPAHGQAAAHPPQDLRRESGQVGYISHQRAEFSFYLEIASGFERFVKWN